MVKEILRNRPLFNECIDALDAFVLPQEESDKMSILFKQMYPLTKWGKIDWDKISLKKNIGCDQNKIIPTLEQLTREPLEKNAYIEWSDAALPVIQTNLNRIITHFDDITCVTFEKFIFNPDKGYIIEVRPGDEITVGIIDSH
jgi:hypothetical protein